MDPNSLGAALAGLFSGGVGLSQLFGSGLGSVSGSAQTGAAAANPFGALFSQYQPQLQTAINQQGTNQGTATSSIDSLIQQLLGSSSNATAQSLQGIFRNPAQMSAAQAGSPTSLNSQLNNLVSNFMNDPVIQAEYQTGLQSVNRGLAASGNLGSGAQQVELEKFGQQFAAEAYQQQFQDIINQSNSVYQQNAGNLAQNLGIQAQQFGQGSSLQQQLMTALSGAGSLQSNLNSNLLSSQQSLIQDLLQASGANSSNPTAAGQILAGAFNKNQQALANVGGGLSGLLSGLLGGGGSGGTSFGNNIGNLLNNLFSTSAWSSASGLLGGADLTNLLGLSGTGDFGSALGISGLFGTGGADAFSAGSQIGSYAGLGGLFDSGSAAAAGAGAAEGGAAGTGALAGAGTLAGAAALPGLVWGVGSLLGMGLDKWFGGTTSDAEAAAFNNWVGASSSSIQQDLQSGGMSSSQLYAFLPYLLNANGGTSQAGPTSSLSQWLGGIVNSGNTTTPWTSQDISELTNFYNWATQNQSTILAANQQAINYMSSNPYAS